MKRKVISLLCAMMLLAVLFVQLATAASASGTANLPTNIPKSFPMVKQDSTFKVVNFWHAMGGNNGVLTANIVNWYNSTEGKKNKIYVKSIFQGDYNAIATKMNAAIQAQNIKVLPDLVQLNATGAFGLKESKNILYVEDMIKADPSFSIKDKLNKNALWACSYKGKLMGMPFSNSMIALHYNVAAFKAAGLNPDSPPKTLSELAEYAKKLVLKGNGSKPARYGCAHRLNLYAIATWVPRQKKGTAFQFDQEDGRLGAPKKYLAGPDGTLKATITEWKKVYDTGALNHTSANASNFANGMDAMYMESMVQYDQIDQVFVGIKDKSKVFEHRMTRIPSVNADDSIGTAIGGSALYMVDKYNEVQKQATWNFVKFIASTDVSAYWYVKSGYFPLNSDALKTKYVGDMVKASPNKAAMLKVRDESANAYKFQETWCPGISQYSSSVENGFLLVANGKSSIDEMIKSVEKKVDSLLKTYWDANS